MNKQIAKGSLENSDRFYAEGAATRSRRKKSSAGSGKTGNLANADPSKPTIPFQMETLATIEPVRRAHWIIRGLMPARGLHVIYGAPAAGKSFVAIHAALHIAEGLPWASRQVNRCGVIYVASEGSDAIRTRVAAARDRLRISPDAPFGLIAEAPTMGHKPEDTQKLIDSIKQQASQLSCAPGVIFLDTLSRSIEGLDENKSEDIMVFVKRAKQIAKELDCLVVPIHHAGKDKERGMRGSSALNGATDAEWLIEREQDSDSRAITIQKMRDGADGLPLAFKLATVGVGPDDEGHPIQTCVMEFAERSPTFARPSGSEQTLLDALRMFCHLEGKADAIAPAGARVVEEKRFKQSVAGANVLPNMKAASLNSRFPSHLANLESSGLIGREGGKLWIAAKAMG